MPVEYTEPVLVPAFASGGSLSVVLEVADAPARLALSLGAVTGNTVKQLDTSAAWMLRAGGVPAVSGDWVQVAAPTTSLAYAAITGKPATFPATTHNHDDLYLTEAELAAALALKAGISHTHANADLVELAASLALKAPVAHTHPNADLTQLAASLAAKAEAAHVHAIADVTGLQAELDAPRLDVPVISRAAISGPPDLPQTLTISGTSAANGVSSAGTYTAGRLLYNGLDYGVYWSGGNWNIQAPAYHAYTVSDALSPFGLSGWYVTVGSGLPTLTPGASLAAAAIGQECHYGDDAATRAIYKATALSPTVWQHSTSTTAIIAALETLSPAELTAFRAAAAAAGIMLS